MDDSEDQAELRNPFPSPPSHYANHTTHNLSLLSLLLQRATEQSTDLTQQDILHDQLDVPEWPLTELQKPRIDWILQDGEFSVFGESWHVKETIPSLADSGGRQLYPADPNIDRRPALLSILRSLLVAYSSLTASLLKPPPVTPSATPEWHRHAEWISVMAQNIMAAANDLRPVQARGNLELMMKRQLELRTEETNALHETCNTLETKLAELQNSAKLVVSCPSDGQFPPNASSNMQDIIGDDTRRDVNHVTSSVSQDHVIGWAEGIRILQK